MSLLLLFRNGGGGSGTTSGYYWAEIPTSLLGTGLKILVQRSDGSRGERVTTEGTPLVMVNGIVRELQSGETLEQ